MRTRVYLTIDVECAEERVVRGVRAPPLGYDLRVWGRFDNQRRELGIGAIMNELEAHGARATFFVEPFGSSFFGRTAFRDVCDAIRGRGHDIQLHAHPIQQNPGYLSRGEAPAADDIGAYDEARQEALLRAGLATLVDAGVPAGDLLAFRAGNFGAANGTWPAIARAGLVLSSSYNPCYFGKACKMRFEGAGPGLFSSPARGVYELPISCIEERLPGRRPRYRHLQIAAVSSREIIDALRASRALGIFEVTIVTHSFELFVIDDARARRGHVNTVNLERLRAVIAFLASAEGEFEVDTVGALAARLRAGHEVPRRATETYARSSAVARTWRHAEQLLKRADLGLARVRTKLGGGL